MSDILPYENNPRVNATGIGAVAKSMKEFGVRAPILLDKNRVIIYGHTRFEAAKLNGLKEYPCIIADDLTEDKVKAYRIADNAVADFSSWDEDKLLIELKDLGQIEFKELPLVDYGLDDFLSKIKHVSFTAIQKDSHGSEDDSENYDPKLEFSIFEEEEILKEAFKCFRENGFPYPKLKRFELMIEMNKLKSLPLEKCISSPCGYRIADTFNFHRFHASANGMRSPYESFNDDVALLKALRMNLEGTGSLAIKYLGIFSLINGTQACSNFRPAFAKYLYNKYCPEKGMVFDSSMGYGGRLTGFLASHADTYISTDPNTVTYNANLKLAEQMNRHKKVFLFNKPVEDLDVESFLNKCDLAFTSPPYFSKELYSEEETQSYKRYPDYADWLKGFLTPMIQKNYDVLKRDRFFILNIEDVLISGDVHPLVQHSIDIGKKIGFSFERIDKFQLPVRTTIVDGQKQIKEAYESVIIFKKN